MVWTQETEFGTHWNLQDFVEHHVWGDVEVKHKVLAGKIKSHFSDVFTPVEFDQIDFGNQNQPHCSMDNWLTLSLRYTSSHPLSLRKPWDPCSVQSAAWLQSLTRSPEMRPQTVSDTRAVCVQLTKECKSCYLVIYWSSGAGLHLYVWLGPVWQQLHSVNQSTAGVHRVEKVMETRLPLVWHVGSDSCDRSQRDSIHIQASSQKHCLAIQVLCLKDRWFICQRSNRSKGHLNQRKPRCNSAHTFCEKARWSWNNIKFSITSFINFSDRSTRLKGFETW